MPSGPTATDRLLVGLSRIVPGAEDLARVPGLIPGTVDWSELVRRAAREGVSPLVYRNLKPFEASVPAEALASLRTSYYANEVRNSRLIRRIAPLIGAVGAAGLRAVVTKGARLALTVYPDIGLRPFTDIDLVVDPRDWPGLEKVLAGLEYIPESHGRTRLDPGNRALDWTFAPYFRLGDLLVELHFAYLGLHVPFRSEEDFWASVGWVRVDGADARIMSPEYELCYLCLHAQQHSYARLMWLTDIAELGSRAEIDRDKLLRIARREGIVAVVRHGFELVNALWPGTIPKRLVSELRMGRLESVLLSAFWPPGRILRRAGRIPMPYYTPTFFSLLSRRKPLLAARTLLRILFPPMDWIADSYNVVPWSSNAWLRYARRLGAPLARLLDRTEREA
ncbi:MAG TPA: nucleotidyltransferase family protein [Acidobacteriota bacterium]|nr:nucleotidyltransferase family protein [Acidobacteriota bacterium]